MKEAENGSEAVQICERQRPDIVLMDIGLPGLNGIETTRELRRLHPQERSSSMLIKGVSLNWREGFNDAAVSNETVAAAAGAEAMQLF